MYWNKFLECNDINKQEFSFDFSYLKQIEFAALAEMDRVFPQKHKHDYISIIV